MKTISRIIKIAGSVGIAALLIATSAAPTFAVSTLSSANACAKLTTLSSTTNETISEHIATMNGDFQTRLTNISNREASVDQKVAENRAKAAADFNTKITNLQAGQNLTTIQQAAIRTYANDMTAAEQARAAAVDAARDAYRPALAAAVETHQTNLATAAATFKTSISTAFTIARASCGQDAVVASLRGAIKTARDTFKAARTDAKVTSQIKALIATRDIAIKTADADFTKAVAGYTATLSAILEATPATTNAQ